MAVEHSVGESLNATDYAYFKSAMDGVAQANAVLAFVQSQLIQRYGLQDGDEIQLDGRIVRKSNGIQSAEQVSAASESESIQ
jgi:hypothetical protein